MQGVWCSGDWLSTNILKQMSSNAGGWDQAWLRASEVWWVDGGFCESWDSVPSFTLVKAFVNSSMCCNECGKDFVSARFDKFAEAKVTAILGSAEHS